MTLDVSPDFYVMRPVFPKINDRREQKKVVTAIKNKLKAASVKWDGKRFATEAKAKRYAKDVEKRTGIKLEYKKSFAFLF